MAAQRAVPKPEPDLVGRRADPGVFEYHARDVVLYNLSVGAGQEDLSLVWEDAPGGVEVLPSFCLVAMNALGGQFTDLIERFHRVEAGEHLWLHRPLPVPGRLVVNAEVSDLFDKDTLALMVTRVWGETPEGERVFDLASSSALLGSGGFGGPRGPSRSRQASPRRPADVEVSCAVPENQALLYQLNGIDDPLHVDPEFARSRGFDRPILHGPCTFGYATRILVQEVCGGQSARLEEIGARFSAPVYPGDELAVLVWEETGGHYRFEARTQRGRVLTEGHAVVS